MSDKVNETTLNNILDTMKSLIQKAQIMQGPHSAAGTLDTQTSPEIFENMETRSDPSGADYIPTPPGVSDPQMGGSVRKAQDDDEDEKEAEDEEEEEGEEGEEEEDEDEDEDKDEDKDEEAKKSQTVSKAKRAQHPTQVPGEKMEKRCMKKSEAPHYDYDYEEVLPVDNVILELTKVTDYAMKSLATRVDFFMKAFGAHQFEMLKSLTTMLASTTEQIAKSFNIVQEETAEPAYAPKSAMTPEDIQKAEKSASPNYDPKVIGELMTKAILEGNKVIQPQDVSLLETSGKVRPEVMKELGF